MCIWEWECERGLLPIGSESKFLSRAGVSIIIKICIFLSSYSYLMFNFFTAAKKVDLASKDKVSLIFR